MQVEANVFLCVGVCVWAHAHAIDWLTQQDDVAQIWNMLNCSGYKVQAKLAHIIIMM